MLKELVEFRRHQVPDHIIFKFLEYIVVPSSNYGAFLDPETEESKYKEIDHELVKFAN